MRSAETGLPSKPRMAVSTPAGAVSSTMQVAIAAVHIGFFMFRVARWMNGRLPARDILRSSREAVPREDKQMVLETSRA